MDHSYSNTKPHQKGKHLTLNDRTTIQELHSKGYSNRAIARELNCSPSTVGYELKRGTVSLYTGNVKRGIQPSKGKALMNYIEANAAARACFFTDISSSTMFPTASIIEAGLLMLAWVMLWPRESSRRIRSYQPKLCITTLTWA